MHILSQETNQGQPEGQPGPMVSGHWLCLTVRKDSCFSLFPWVMVTMDINQFGVSVSHQLNIKRELPPPRAVVMQRRRTARPGVPMEQTLITSTLQLRKVRLTEFTQATLGRPGLKPRWPRASAALLYHQDVWGPVPVASCPSLNVSVPHVLISQKGVKIFSLLMFWDCCKNHVKANPNSGKRKRKEISNH